MTRSQTNYSVALASCLTLMISGCSSDPSQLLGAGYKTARAQSSLEIPPDLISTTSSHIKKSGRNLAATKVLPAINGLTIEGDGLQRYLRVSANAEDAWAKTVDYATKNNLPILSESKRDGILETDWIGDTSTETATESRIRSIIGNIVGRAPINDKYKFWLERLNETETAIHVDHSRLSQRVIEPKNQHDNIEVRWIEQAGSGVEALRTLRDLMTFFGGVQEAHDNILVQLLTDNTEEIILSYPMDAAWSTLGNAIKHTRYSISDIKRNKRLYVIKQPKDSGGILARFSFKKKLGVKVEKLSDQKSRITITTSRGKYLDRDEALPVLYAITGELRKLQ